MAAFPLFLVVLLGACIAFGALFLLARRLDNFGIVDVAWAAGFIPVAIAFATSGPAPMARRLMLVGLVAVWSARLTWQIGHRVWRSHPVEDGRYQQLRRDWAGRFTRTMAAFFQGQAGVLVMLAVPFLLISRNSDLRWSALEVAGAGVVALAIAGEGLADAQLNRFKRDPLNRGRVCAAGLWRFSRHPNYFFEWLVWVGFALWALPAPHGWLGLLSPVLMLALLLFVTGIPYTEAQLRRSKGRAYDDYRQRTSAFIPWPPA